MIVHLRYYALFQHQAGRAAEDLETEAPTAADLWAEVSALRGLSLDRSLVRVAVDDEFSPWDRPLTPGATVVFLPPVAGG